MFNKRISALFGKRGNQEGITIVEISVGLAILAVLAIFLAPRAGALFGKARIELAQQEMITLVTAALQYRQAHRGYGSITIAALQTGGYHIEPFTADSPTNAYGKIVQLEADGTTKAKFTYPTDETEECTQLKERLGQLKPTIASCTDKNLMVEVL